jgi:hypothetical protein
MDPTTNTTCLVAIVAASNSTKSVLDFKSAGQTNATYRGRIQLDHNTNLMTFSTLNGTALCVEGGKTDNTVLVGTTVSATAGYRLWVNGYQFSKGSYVEGNQLVTGTKSFDIPHPCKPNYRLRHRCIESPEARLLYEFQLDCVEGLNVADLPEYFAPLNKDVRVYCSPYMHFGSAWGEVAGTQLRVTSNASGKFNVLLLGTRNDGAAQREFEEYGVEYVNSKSGPV